MEFLKSEKDNLIGDDYYLEDKPRNSRSHLIENMYL